MQERERDVERTLSVMVRRHGGWCLKWVCPGWSGAPDRIVLLPGGRVIFVEVKRSNGGRVHPRQAWFAEQLQALGCQHRFVWSREDIEKLEQEIKGAKE